MATKALMTVEQFAQMQTADTEDYELVRGELIPLSSGTLRHAAIRDGLVYLLWSYFRSNPIGRAYAEVDCRLNDEVVRRPDLSIYLGESVARLDPDRIPAPFAPEIAVEILSPSESAIGLRHKVRDYLRAGCKEVWLLDHSNGELQICTTNGVQVLQQSDALQSPHLPGFNAPINELM
jgi:Uma2 family endonuclease